MADYVTEPEFRDYIGSKGTGSATSIQAAITAASRSIDAYCFRHFDRREDGVRYYTPAFDTEQYLLPVDDIATTVDLEVATGSGDGSYSALVLNSTFSLEPANGMIGGLAWPYTSLRSLSGMWPRRTVPTQRDTVRVTATFGWPEVPDEVKQAARILAAQYWKLGDAPLGVAGWGAYGDIRVREVPQAATLLAPFRKGSSFGIA